MRSHRGLAASVPVGSWSQLDYDPRTAPAAAWGVSAVQLPSATIAFGGEHPLGLAHERFATLWQVGSAAQIHPITRSTPAPSARRSHAAAPLGDDGMLLIGGRGEPDGAPLGEAWMLQRTGGSSSSSSGSGSNISGARRSSNGGGNSTAMLPRRATWTRNGLEHAAAALLARVGHSITPLPPPPGGPLYLREPSDAAYLLFGGRSSPRVAAVARALPDRASSVAWSSATLTEYEAAANADAAEPGASPVSLNDLLLLTRGRAMQWQLTRLMAADQVGCTSASTFASAAAAAASPHFLDVRARRARAVASGGSHQRASALQPLELSDAEVEVLRAARAPRSRAPCARHGHSAHFYAGGVGSLPASWCAASRHGGHASGSSSGLSSGSGSGSGGGEVGGEVGEGAGGCLLVHGGADAASSPSGRFVGVARGPAVGVATRRVRRRGRSSRGAHSSPRPPARCPHHGPSTRRSWCARRSLSAAARRRGSRAAPAPRHVRSQGLAWSVALGLAARGCGRFTCPRCGGRSCMRPGASRTRGLGAAPPPCSRRSAGRRRLRRQWRARRQLASRRE